MGVARMMVAAKAVVAVEGEELEVKVASKVGAADVGEREGHLWECRFFKALCHIDCFRRVKNGLVE